MVIISTYKGILYFYNLHSTISYELQAHRNIFESFFLRILCTTKTAQDAVLAFETKQNMLQLEEFVYQS